MTTVGIIQPNFIPWRGYFDFIRDVDVFVFLDDVQYTRRDWRNRNRIRTLAGPSRWLTVPVTGASRQPINTVLIDPDSAWRNYHLSVLRENYRDAPYVHEVVEMLDKAYSDHVLLADLNIEICQQILAMLGIRTPLQRASSLRACGQKDTRLIALTQELGGTRYLSGPAARAYLRPPEWEDAGIELSYKVYPDYPAYQQIAKPYDPLVSVIDLIMMTGAAAKDYLGVTA